jgi:hypothetical protein
VSAIDEIVQVTISQQTAAVSRAGFGVPLVFGSASASSGWTEKFRTYTGMTGVAADFGTSDTEYKMAAALFAQSPAPASIMIGKRAANVAAVKTLTFAGDIITDNTVALKVNGATVTVPFNSTHAQTMTDLDTAISAVEGIASVTIGGSGSRIATITATEGYELTLADCTVTGGVSHTTGTFAVSEAGKTVASELDLLRLETDAFYAVLLTSTVFADQLTCAAWTESQKKIYLTRSNVAGILAATTTDIAARLHALSYHRSAVMYYGSTDDYRDAAWAGACLPLDPGSETWKFKTLVGVVPDSLTTTQITNAQGKRCNLYRTIGGINVTSEGYAASGRFLDQTRGIDWLEARLQEDVFQVLATTPKVPYTDAGVMLITAPIRARLANGVAVGLLADDPAPTVTAPLVADVNVTDRANRLLPDVTFSATLAGAIHSVQIAGVVSV